MTHKNTHEHMPKVLFNSLINEGTMKMLLQQHQGESKEQTHIYRMQNCLIESKLASCRMEISDNSTGQNPYAYLWKIIICIALNYL